MAVPVPFGQYVPGSSAVHTLDARAKLGVVLGFTAVLFATQNPRALLFAGAVLLGLIAVSGIPWRLVIRGLKPILWIAGFTLVVNAVRWQADDVWLSLGPLGIDADGLGRGLYFAVRIVLLVLGTSLVTLTTSPVALTDAMASLMRPLRLVRVPVDDVAMMLSIALRFVPTTAEEAEKVVVAQTARGAVFDEGGPVKRARAWVPVLVPLFVRLFRRADDLALAMESRCYTGVGRTRLKEQVMEVRDWLVVASTTVLASVAIWIW